MTSKDFDANFQYMKFHDSVSVADPKLAKRFTRLNMTCEMEAPYADQYKAMSTLARLTTSGDVELKHYLAEAKRQLWASLFYFVPDKKSYKHLTGYRIDGHLRCRLDARDSVERKALRKLREKISSFAERIFTSTGGQEYRDFGGSANWDKFVGEDGFSLRCSIEIEDMRTEYDLVAVLARDENEKRQYLIPISGFPCSFAGMFTFLKSVFHGSTILEIIHKKCSV